MKGETYILGGSGHALVVHEIMLLNDLEVKGYFDLNVSAVMPEDLAYLGEETLENLKKCKEEAFFFPAVGNNRLRSDLVSVLQDRERKQLTLIHPDATVSKNTRIGLSTMIGPRAVVNPFAEIGKGVIINSGAVIEHECKVEDFCHIAPGATLLGNVQVGAYSFVGGNAVVKQGVKIGSNVIVGAGAVVLNDIPDNSVVAGNPAKLLK